MLPDFNACLVLADDVLIYDLVLYVYRAYISRRSAREMGCEYR